MTVPIQPGPFAFLAEAGQAVGQIGQALQAKRQRLDTEARNRLSDILSLINAGADPSPFLAAGGEAAEHLRLAPPGQGSALLAGPAERARIALDLARATSTDTGNKARISGAAADVAPQMAGAELRTAVAGATKAEVDAQAAQSDLPIKQRINELVTTELENPESGFAQLAARAAAGTLHYYTAMMQIRGQDRSLERERMRETHDLFMIPLEQAGPVWKARSQDWDTRKLLETTGYTPEQVKKWETDNPRPSLKAIQQELLENAAQQRGLTPDEYNNVLNRSIGLLTEVRSSVMTPQKIQLLTQYVGEVSAGKRTVAEIEAEIRAAYQARGTPGSDAQADLDVLEFKAMLQEAQGAKPKR